MRGRVASGALRVNGQAMKEPFIKNSPASHVSFDVTVPPDRIWLMSDNRHVALDSRAHIGTDGGGTVGCSRHGRGLGKTVARRPQRAGPRIRPPLCWRTCSSEGFVGLSAEPVRTLRAWHMMVSMALRMTWRSYAVGDDDLVTVYWFPKEGTGVWATSREHCSCRACRANAWTHTARPARAPPVQRTWTRSPRQWLS
ncbi:S26 family signal peptidase [Nonomuraea sp. NPDC055795]